MKNQINIMKVNFTITTDDVKNVCDREGMKYLGQSDHEQILKDTKRIYELNIKQDICEYICGQAFNHLNKLKAEYNKKNNYEK
tara:strand:- start:46115 stop:46363 length:249 start_codon:yes stop_codon:yes gene_type:complete